MSEPISHGATDEMTSPGFRLVLRSLDRVETGLGALSDKFDSLGDKFVPRAELNGWKDNCDSRHHQSAERLTALETGRTADRQYVDDAVEKAEARRIADRNTTRMTLLMVLGLVITVLSLVIAHWR